MDHFNRGSLRFDVADAGPPDGEAVILLHGWPAGAACWDVVSARLRTAGLRTLAPDQRGYSPGARPRGRAAYAVPELVDDVLALADAAGVGRFHLVGHDWGGAVAWALATGHPDRLSSLTVLSTPHPRAMARSLLGSQLLRSSYVAFFQLPVVPEAVLLSRGGEVLERVLRHSGLPADRAADYVARQREPGALSAALAWYRALLAPPSSVPSDPVSVPTTFVWSTGDGALGRSAAERTAEHVSGPYRFEVLEGVSHWLPETVPDRVAELILEQVTATSGA